MLEFHSSLLTPKLSTILHAAARLYTKIDGFPGILPFPKKFYGTVFVTDSTRSFSSRGSTKLLAFNRYFLIGQDQDKVYKGANTKCGGLNDRYVRLRQ